VKLRPAFEKDKEKSGSMYVLFNQKTLGVSEQEVIQILEKIARQLEAQEQNLRRYSIDHHRIWAEDICYKAYGNLRYSRLMNLQTATHLLSQLRWGQEEQVIQFEKYCNFYELMIGIQPANLSVFFEKQLEGEEQDQARALYLQRFLPELKKA
jgi:protein arginine kinase